MTAFRLVTLTTLAELRGLEPEWRKLEQRAARLPFVSFDWVDAWWQQLRQDGLGARDDLELWTLRSEQGELLAVAPLMVTSRPGRGPIRVRHLQSLGADPNITEIRCIVAAEGLELPAYRALLEALQGATQGWGWVALSGVPSELRAATSGDSFERVRWLREFQDFSLELPDSWQAFKQALPRNMKESLRKCYNSLKRDQHEASLAVVTTLGAAREAIELFFGLHRERARRPAPCSTTTSFAGQSLGASWWRCANASRTAMDSGRCFRHTGGW
jgi:CelD/BcsL family acetyltransferase involved in cellulose biosynthesis